MLGKNRAFGIPPNSGNKRYRWSIPKRYAGFGRNQRFDPVAVDDRFWVGS